jgi:hypothetical protein
MLRFALVTSLLSLLTLSLPVEADDTDRHLQPASYTIPTIDLADQVHRQVIVDREAGQDLMGHWQLATDAKDSSGHDYHGQSHSVSFAVAGRAEEAGKAASFDGRRSIVEVANNGKLELGTEEFSLALWIHTEQELDDTLGDLMGKFDEGARRGFNFSIQNYSGVTSSQSNDRHVHFGIDNGRSEAGWTDHGQLGNAMMIFGMAVYQGQLFAGTCEAGKEESGRVFRFDGKTWTDCGSPDKCNAVSSLAVHEGQLYVGVSKYRLGGSSLPESTNQHLGGTVYRYLGDHRWANCGKLEDTSAINGMVVYRDKLYASSMYAPAGFFRYDGGTTWTSCGTPDGKRVESLSVYNGEIFATGYDEGAVYRYDGHQWQHSGFIEGATQTYGFATYQGDLFVSEWPHAKVLRWGGAADWLYAGRLGEEKETMPLMVYNGKLYGGTLPLAGVYRYDQRKWTSVGRVDHTPEVRYRRAWTMAIYQGRLFVGALPSGHVQSIEFGRNVTYDHALPTGWVHLAAVRDADELRLYVNGRRVATSAKFTAEDYDLTNDQPLKIGFGAHDYFNGKMQDVRIYRRALAEDEIERMVGE